MIITPCKMRVTFTTKTSYQSPYKCISHIGGYGWCFSQEQAVSAIFNQQYYFYTHINDRTVNIIIGSEDGNPYLKTEIDREQPEQLLALPDFDEKGTLLTLTQNKIFLESFGASELKLAEYNQKNYAISKF